MSKRWWLLWDFYCISLWKTQRGREKFFMSIQSGSLRWTNSFWTSNNQWGQSNTPPADQRCNATSLSVSHRHFSFFLVVSPAVAVQPNIYICCLLLDYHKAYCGLFKLEIHLHLVSFLNSRTNLEQLGFFLLHVLQYLHTRGLHL